MRNYAFIYKPIFNIHREFLKCAILHLKHELIKRQVHTCNDGLLCLWFWGGKAVTLTQSPRPQSTDVHSNRPHYNCRIPLYLISEITKVPQIAELHKTS